MLTSCEYFNVKKTSSEAILNEELQTFNWESVDHYPTFSKCDSSKTKNESIACFQNTLVNHINAYLQQEIIIVTQDVTDTLQLHFQVNRLGELTIKEAKIDSITLVEIPNIKSLLHESLEALPKIFPAIKRGQQVTTEFNLPIIIHVN
jgi:hypothetical protein